jgi:alkylation response protein AidB-like acyl-CoA dehydrogenase
MDTLMTEEQEMVRDSARSFLESEATTKLVREMEKDPLGYDPGLWAKAAELGWQGLALPEEDGGSGLSLVYLGVVLSEVGRALAPIPLHSTSVAALTISESASADLRSEVLPGVIEGSVILTYAADEEELRGGPAAVKLTATQEGDSFVLNGTKCFVDNFEASKYCLVVCRTANATRAQNGISLLLVDTSSDGITATPLVTTAKDRQSEVHFENVRVAARNIVGALNEGWPIAERMLDRATALLCSQMMGASRKNAEMAIEYAKMREAFGQPIGSFQSIQHMCADMIIWIDGGELLTFEALWKMDENLPCQVEVSQAKAFCNEKALASARNAQIIYGGIGFMMELDLHLWYRRVAAWTMRLGTTYTHRARVANALIDHPGEVILGRPLPGTESVVHTEGIRKSA